MVELVSAGNRPQEAKPAPEMRKMTLWEMLMEQHKFICALRQRFHHDIPYNETALLPADVPPDDGSDFEDQTEYAPIGERAEPLRPMSQDELARAAIPTSQDALVKQA